MTDRVYPVTWSLGRRSWRLGRVSLREQVTVSLDRVLTGGGSASRHPPKGQCCESSDIVIV